MGENNPFAVFEATVARAEAAANRNLRAYKARLLLFALLGYGAIFAILALLVAIVGGLAATAFLSTHLFVLLLKKKLLFVLIPTIWILLKALWVRLEAPSGYPLTREAFPALHAELDALRRQLRTPRIHEVILTPELNAAVAQTPRLGMFGWYRNTLILGMELLMTLSPAQARAVVAHELGHLSGNHSRFNGWIYRVRMSWQRIMNAFDEQVSLGARLMRRFFDWYAPRFAAYSFALARINEYEADAASAELTSPAEAGAALVNTHVTGPYVDERYWSDYFRQADEMPAPRHMPWVGLRAFLRERDGADGQLGERLEAALAQETALDDTHPCLADRLRALGAAAELPAPPAQTAAEAWLGEGFAEVLRDLDRDWVVQNGPRWQERYD